MSYETKKTKKGKEERYKYLKCLLYGGDHPKFDYEPYGGYYVGFENESNVIAWKKYLSLGKTSQQKLKDQWGDYYEKAYSSYEGERYTQLRIALAFKDPLFVREFSQKKYNSSPSLKKPSSVDPELLYQSGIVKKWYSIKSLLKEMDAEGMNQDLLSKAQDIFVRS